MFAFALTSLEKRIAARPERIHSSDLLKENEEKSLTSCSFFGKQTTKLLIHFRTDKRNNSKI
jgi:hypothetical protein